MAHINYIKLYNYFKEKEDLSTSETLRNIWRVGNLPQEFKTIVQEIVEERENNVVNFSVYDVTLLNLVEDEQMKWVQAVFFLEWLKREPENARAFMVSRRLRTPIQEIDEDNRQIILNALTREKAQTGKDVPSALVPEDNSGKDIEIETESENVGVMVNEIVPEHAEIDENTIQEMVKDAL